MLSRPQTITIIGAGLNGPLLGLSLAKRGFRVEIYERRPDMRRVRIEAGRSINLALSTRGIHALQTAGLWDSLRNLIIPMKGRMMHSIAGELTFQPYGKDEAIHFDQRCIGFELKSGALRLRHEESRQETTLESNVVIGCDGSASAIRHEMLKLNRFNFSQQYLDYGYKELTIPSKLNGGHALEKHALHIWPRGSFMLIALPNVDGTFACILFLPFEGPDSFATLTRHWDVVKFFEGRFPDVVPLTPHLTDNYFTNPTGTMVTIKCSTWYVEGKSLLLV